MSVTRLYRTIERTLHTMYGEATPSQEARRREAVSEVQVSAILLTQSGAAMTSRMSGTALP